MKDHEIEKIVKRLGVPTNAELEARFNGTAYDAIRGWLSRHPMPSCADREKWLDWATHNLMNDPEVKRFIKIE